MCNVAKLNPDSSTNELVENCYISVGYDALAIKSGWDKYGMEYNRPCVNVTIRNAGLEQDLYCPIWQPNYASLNAPFHGNSAKTTNMSIISFYSFADQVIFGKFFSKFLLHALKYC